MALETSVKSLVKDGMLIIMMDEENAELKKALWKTIHQFSGKVKKADVGVVLGIVQYELLHHNEKDI